MEGITNLPADKTVSLGDDDYIALNLPPVVALTATDNDLPGPGYIATDRFGFVANDGGVPPEGRDSV